MNLQNWIIQARASWKAHNPTYYNELNRSGMLGITLKEAAERTHAEMMELEDSGYSNQEAWEMTRERYLFLQAELEPDEVESEGVKLSQSILALQNKILQSLNDASNIPDEDDQDYVLGHT